MAQKLKAWTGIYYFQLISSFEAIRERRRHRLKTLAACSLCILCFAMVADDAQAPVTDGKPLHNIALTEASDIADAAVINATISVLVKDAASCPAAASKNRQPCACSFEDDLKKLKSAYAALAKHPGWNDVVVAYTDPANRKSVSLNLPGIKRQLDACAQHQQ